MSDYEKIYVRFRGRTLGPLTPQKVRDLVRRGQITRMHELSADGLSWTKAEEFGEFFTSGSVVVTTDEPMSEQPVAVATEIGSGSQDFEAGKDVKDGDDWYAHIDGQNCGPVSLAQIENWKSSGQLQGHTLVWRSGLDSWQSAEQALPELFASKFPVQQLVNRGSTQIAGGGGDGLHSLASEMDRRRGWAFFFAVLLIVLSSFQIIGQLITIFAAATANDGAVVALVGGFVGIAFAGTIMTAGILLLQYVGELKQFAINPTHSSSIVTAKRLSAFWAFAGISSLIWLVIFVSVLFVVISIGLSAFDALN